MTIVTYVPVVEASTIPVGKMKEVDMEGGRIIVIAHTASGFFAFQRECPHSGTRLSLGKLHDKAVECPNHHYFFDLDSGQITEPKLPCEAMATYKVEEQDGMVCLKIEF